MASIYYVATGGNNSASGAIGAPWLTLAHGLAHLTAGDTLLLRGGAYANQRIFEVDFIATGTSWANAITVAPYPGETVELYVPAGGDNVIRFQDGSVRYVILGAFVVDGSLGMDTSTPIYFGPASHHLRLQSLELKNSRYHGLNGDGAFHEFLDLDVHGNGTSGGSAPLTGLKKGNGLYLTCSDSAVVGGRFHNNASFGIRWWHSGHPTLTANRNVVDKARLYGNGYGIGIGGASISTSGGGGLSIGDNDNTVKNCLITGNFWGIDDSFAHAVGTKYRNNTLTDNLHGVNLTMGSGFFQNNISFDNGDSDLVDTGSSNTKDHNLTTDPLFTDAPGGDYTWPPGSDAEGAGATLADVPDDFSGDARTAPYDIGAYITGAVGGGVGDSAPPVLVGPSAGGTQLLTFSMSGNAPLERLSEDGSSAAPPAGSPTLSANVGAFEQFSSGDYLATNSGPELHTYDDDFVARASNAHGSGAGADVDAVGNAYVIYFSQPGGIWQTEVLRVDADAATLDSWVVVVGTLLDDPIQAHGLRQGVAVNAAGTIAYTFGMDPATADVSAVYAWDLAGDTDLGLFVAGDGVRRVFAGAVHVLPTGDVLVGWSKRNGAPGAGDTAEIERFNSAGVSQAVYTLPTPGSYAPRSVLAITSAVDADGPIATSFWASYWTMEPSFGEVEVVEIRVADGTILHEFPGPAPGSFTESWGPFVVGWVAGPAPLSPVPIPTPPAAHTPCDPQSPVGNGGTGHSGCNTGGTGWIPQYPPDLFDVGGVPQHPDPVDGETLTNKRGVDVWVELVHTEYPPTSPATTTYRRSFVELADLPSYEGGRKTEGLKAIGDVEHGLSNEQGGFEAATVDIEYADQVDRLFRGLLETQDLELDEVRVKAATPLARLNGDAPRVLARAVVQRATLAAPMSARITAVDELFADFGPFGPERQFPGVTFGDLGDAMPDAPLDTKAQTIPVLYGEKSDHGAVPISRGLLPCYYCGKFDLTSVGLGTPPPTPGYTLPALVAALQASVDAATTDADWGDCIGHADAGILEGMGVVPSDYTRLASVIGYGDLDALLNGTCGGGETAPPDDTGWGFLAFGLGTWFRFTELYGSNLSGGDAVAQPDRVLLDPSTRSDMLVPGFTWPFATQYTAFTNPETGQVYWLTGIWVRGPLLDDQINGKVNITANAIGNEDIGDGTGLPIIEAHAVQQHWIENYLLNDWTSGLWADDTTYPIWEDGVPKVRSSSFTARQAFTTASLGGIGLTVGWYANTARGLSDWFSEWNASTESRLGFNGHGQIMVWGLDETVDASAWPRIDHVVDVFGPITWTSGEERENVVTGSCDWDPDGQKYRVGPVTKTSAVGVALYKGHRKPGTPITSTILNLATHLDWVLTRRLARLRVGTKLFDVPGKIDLLDYDVGTGVRFSSLEGPAAVTMEHRTCVLLRRRFNFATRQTTVTLWDITQPVAALAESPLG